MKYKKLLISLLVFVSIFVIYVFANDKRMNYIALGDSLAIGQNPYGQISYGYADYVSNYLSRNNLLKFYTKNFAESGDTIEDLLLDIKNNKTIQVDDEIINLKASLRQADLVTISIGANDFISGMSLSTLNGDFNKDDLIKKTDAIMPSLDEVLKEIRRYAKGEVVVIGFYNPLPRETSNYKEMINELFAYIDSNYQQICDKYKITYLPIYSAFENHTDYLPNPFDIHPNSKGYEVISSNIIDYLEKNVLN